MEFSFEVDPNTDLAIGTELVIKHVVSFEDDDQQFDITGYDPLTPTGSKPGSEDKVKMLAARYSAGVPLWHDSDCYDHGPAGSAAAALFGAENAAEADEVAEIKTES